MCEEAESMNHVCIDIYKPQSRIFSWYLKIQNRKAVAIA